MAVEIAEMCEADYDEVLALWQAAEGVGLHTGGEAGQGDVDDCDSRAGVARYLRRNPGSCFVARDDGVLVGTVMCGHEGRRAYLNHLAVAASHRRRGIGTALVARCMEAMRRQGIAKCNLFVFADNELATGFWQSQGWKDYNEMGIRVMTRATCPDESERGASGC